VVRQSVCRRVGEFRIEVALGGEDGAGVATAHRDDDVGDNDVGAAGVVVGEGLGELGMGRPDIMATQRGTLHA